jgi:hypothetical protein
MKLAVKQILQKDLVKLLKEIPNFNFHTNLCEFERILTRGGNWYFITFLKIYICLFIEKYK